MEKKEYIERKATLRAVKSVSDGDYAVSAAAYAITQLPAADVAEVVHGHWIDRTEWFGTLGVCKRECSECHTRFDGKPYSRGDGKGSKFCEECGAKMDGGKHER